MFKMRNIGGINMIAMDGEKYWTQIVNIFNYYLGNRCIENPILSFLRRLFTNNLIHGDNISS